MELDEAGGEPAALRVELKESILDARDLVEEVVWRFHASAEDRGSRIDCNNPL
jgi:hypothetical protein